MADINVNYEAIPAKTESMREDATRLNSEITAAYESVAEMHNYWHGKRYNALVAEFNKMTDAINDMLELVVGEIPSALNTIANNYSQADTGAKVATAAKESPRKIASLTVFEDVGMKFVSEQVTTIQGSVSKNFKNSIDLINSFESKFNQVDWQGVAAESFRAKFNKLKGEIVKAFENINSQFTNAMEQTKNDFASTENANNIQ